MSKMEFLTHAINYFEKYGINPVEHESPAQEMQKLIKRMDQVFAFLKKQETDLVRPACEPLRRKRRAGLLPMPSWDRSFYDRASFKEARLCSITEK